tara:strand:+ start:65 stop:724 length:660 start_codon:yes stop_codon:yes gene_type:complete
MKCLVPFGPLIYQGDISEEFLNFLLEGVDRSRNGSDMRSSLAGSISEEKSALYDAKKFQSYIDLHVRRYLYLIHERRSSLDELHIPTKRSEQYKNDIFILDKIITDTNLDYNFNLGGGPWVNYQKSGEFNPIHEHGGNISAIIYLDIPEEINRENDGDQYQVMRAGCLEFVYDNSKTMVITPKTGMIFLFPAELKHCVYPFKSDVERISMSFNLHKESK